MKHILTKKMYTQTKKMPLAYRCNMTSPRKSLDLSRNSYKPPTWIALSYFIFLPNTLDLSLNLCKYSWINKALSLLVHQTLYNAERTATQSTHQSLEHMLSWIACARPPHSLRHVVIWWIQIFNNLFFFSVKRYVLLNKSLTDLFQIPLMQHRRHFIHI